MNNTAENLVGIRINNTWKVVEKLSKKPSDTGGNFSVPYIVENDYAERYFLKAVNIGRALGMPDMMKILEYLTVAHNHECKILSECRELNIPKVIKIVEHGEIVAVNPGDITVPYVIFELANGNIRDKINESLKFDLLTIFNTIHQISVAIKQIHSKNIAHQDIKPSNILYFGDEILKLGDFGRSEIKNITGPHSNLLIRALNSITY